MANTLEQVNLTSLHLDLTPSQTCKMLLDLKLNVILTAQIVISQLCGLEHSDIKINFWKNVIKVVQNSEPLDNWVKYE